jgi:PAS domain S-box-containing protein
MIDSPEAREYLAAIVESSDDAIIGKDLDGTIRSCNPAAERLFGYAAAEMIGRPITTLIPQERQHEEMEILARLRRGEQIQHFETVRLRKSGEAIEVSLSISPIRSAAGALVGAAKIVRDVTERNRTQRALAAQREWFRVTLASIGDAVITCDVDARVTYINSVGELLTGWSAQDAMGRPLVDVFRIIDEHSREAIENPTAKVLRTGYVQGLANHTVLISRDGRERPIADSASPIRSDDGTVLGVVVVFHDASEQRRAEMAIAQHRQWLQTTLESIGDAVIATDRQGRVAFMNRVAEALTGWSASAAHERPCDEVFRIVNEQTRAPVQSPVARVLAEGAVVGLANHTLLLARDGHERPIDDSGAPIRDELGEVAGVVLVFRDVTERRAAAAQREKLLESERAARAEAERASRIKDDFVATASHELRTPLNAILGWTEVLRSSAGDPAMIERAIEVIGRNTRVQAQLVSDLLDISRIVSGKLRLDVESVDLGAVIRDALQTVQHSVQAKALKVHTKIDAQVPRVLGDRDRLQQIVFNLLGNAVKFTPERGEVRVSLRRDTDRAELVVSDTGVGIASDLLPHIFDRFRQSDAPTTRRFGGLGLGLSIVKQLVELHGGTVSAESAGEGRGATLTVRLPFSDGSEERRARTTTQAATAHVEPASLEAIRVLVIDDDVDTLAVVKRLLEGHGAVVATAASAAQALSSLSPEIDVIVSDIGMPDLDGYQLIRNIRAQESAVCRVPAIALTAFARAEDRTRALRAGYQSHLSKPVEPAELVATIASFGGLSRAKRPT